MHGRELYAEGGIGTADELLHSLIASEEPDAKTR